MRNFLYAARQVFKPKWSNLIKTLSLALGIMTGGIFATRVAYEQSYDTYLPNLDQLYRIESNVKFGDRIFEDNSMHMAPVTPAMVAATPKIMAGTRFWEGGSMSYRYGDKFFSLNSIYADSCLFEVLDFGIISGDPKRDLAVAFNSFISQKAAQRIFGNKDPVGETLVYGDDLVPICGVFKDVPENGHLLFDIIVANPEGFPTSWDGGDSYKSYLKLHKNVNPEEVESYFPIVMAANMDVEGLKSKGIEEKYRLQELRSVSTRSFHEIDLIMSLVAFVLVLVGGLNYVLMTISSLSSRAKEIGVHKASGASSSGIFSLILWETVIYIILALGIAGVLLIIFQPFLEEIAGRYSDLFSLANIWTLCVVIVMLILIAGFIPAWIFSRVPVTQIFQRFTDNKNNWKRALLFFQFLSSSLIVTFLLIIIMQYNTMINSDLGYNYDNVAFTELNLGDTKTNYILAATEIERLPFVKKVALANTVPMMGYPSGIGVGDIATGNKYFSCPHLQVEPRFFDLFEIPILQGRNLMNESDSTICLMDQESVRKIKAQGVTDPLGFSFYGNGRLNTVGGIVQQIKLASFHAERFPAIYTCIEWWDAICLIIKFDELTAANMKAVDTKLRELFPKYDFRLWSYSESLKRQYNAEQMFRDGIGIAGIVLIIITVIGVIGYTATEIRRRAREIAIRKIHGSSSMGVIALMMRGIGIISVVASAMGVTAAYFLAGIWIKEFTLKTELSWWIFALGALFVISIVVICVTIQTWRIATENPARSIKSE